MSQSVWTAVTSAPLFVRDEIIRLSKFSAHSTAAPKPAHSRRFANFEPYLPKAGDPVWPGQPCFESGVHLRPTENRFLVCFGREHYLLLASPID
jgi:hypothetical protein